jgi:hypothetical protein
MLPVRGDRHNEALSSFARNRAAPTWHGAATDKQPASVAPTDAARLGRGRGRTAVFPGLSRKAMERYCRVSLRLPLAAVARVPEGATVVGIERMSRAFTKYHLDDGRVLHRFRHPEPDANPHDHPWPFETTILDGGYIDEVFHVDADGSWHSEHVHWQPGETYSVDATHIHRIVALPKGECWTIVRSGQNERETRFWRFLDAVKWRVWHSRKWVSLV